MREKESSKKSKYQLTNDPKNNNYIESIFEKGLWGTRFLVLFAILSSLVSALVLFVMGTVDVIHVVTNIIGYYSGKTANLDLQKDVVGTIIGSVDIFLIAVVFLIFSFGIYELFISHIDIAHQTGSSNILDIESLDQLKDKIGQVLIMALIVKFFQEMLKLNLSDIHGMLFFALSIALLALALFLLQVGKKMSNQSSQKALSREQRFKNQE